MQDRIKYLKISRFKRNYSIGLFITYLPHFINISIIIKSNSTKDSIENIEYPWLWYNPGHPIKFQLILFNDSIDCLDGPDILVA